MLWSDVVDLVEDYLAESAAGTTNFFKEDKIRLWAALAQLKVTREVECLSYDEKDGYEIDLVADQIYYDLPEDALTVTRVQYDDTTTLIPMVGRPQALPFDTGQPTHWWIQTRRKIGIWPTESAASKKIYIFGKRLAPTCAFNIFEDNADSTAATFLTSQRTGRFTITITGGVNAGTYTVDITAAAYDTIGELVTRINALSVGIVAQRNALCPSLKPCDTIETIVGVNIKDTNRRVYFDPEIDDDMLTEIVVESVLAKQREKDRDKQGGEIHRRNAEIGLERSRVAWQRRRIAAGNFRKGNVQGGGGAGAGYITDGRGYYVY